MFKVGDEVVWTSQAAGYSKQKRGVIVEIVKAGERPSRDKFPSLYKQFGCGIGRSSESYVVKVKSRIYWPVAKNLKRSTT